MKSNSHSIIRNAVASIVGQVHSLLTGLDYASSGHTGFEPTVTKGNLTGGTGISVAGGTGAVIGSGAAITNSDTGSGAVTTHESSYVHSDIAANTSARHARSHALDGTSDHTIGGLTNTYLVKSDGTKLVPATNTDAQVSGAVTASHAAVTLDADADVLLDLSTQEIGLDTQTANTVFAGPTTGAANEPTFRALVVADIPSGQLIPAGTKMLFYQDTAPTGWTIENTLDDKVVYITKGSAASGQTGGGVHSTGTWTQPNHTHTGPDHNHTGPSHTHTGPSHTHTGPSHQHTTGDFSITSTYHGYHRHAYPGSEQFVFLGVNNWAGGSCCIQGGSYTGYDGSGSAHNHGSTGAAGTGATGAEGTGNTGSAGTGATGNAGTGNTGGGATVNTWRPSAYCCIICSKN